MNKAIAIRAISIAVIMLTVAGALTLAAAAMSWVAVAAGAKWLAPIPLVSVFAGVFLTVLAIMLIPGRHYYGLSKSLWKMSRRERFKKLRRTNNRFGFLFLNPLHLLVWGMWMASLLILEEKIGSLAAILWASPGVPVVALIAEAVLLFGAPYFVLIGIAVWEGGRVQSRAVNCSVCESLDLETPVQTPKFLLLREAVRVKRVDACTFHMWKVKGNDSLEEYILSVAGNYRISMPTNYLALAVVD